MQKKISLRLLPADAADPAMVRTAVARTAGFRDSSLTGYEISKRSIDARTSPVWVNLTLNAFIDEPVKERELRDFQFNPLTLSTPAAVIIGSGPAGLFAALQLIELGIRPIILERGKEVRARRMDLAILNKQGIINPESNYCFGEGGAGTYSDGKLYTRSNKRGDIDRILQLFVRFGADENILSDSHPHIGTNKLPGIITAIRQQITDCGGEFHFGQKVNDFVVEKNNVVAVKTSDGNEFRAASFILATGHSARDVFELFYRKDLLIEARPFALGVRAEHPQSLIDGIQYHCTSRGEYLPPASYSLVSQLNGRGVFSFCMCPGGIIATASTSPGELVVNGWSPSRRNNPYANSGIVVQVERKDAFDALKKTGRFKNIKEGNPLLMMYFQQQVENDCFSAGGGLFIAPAQRMEDFSQGKFSASLPSCTYIPGIRSAQLSEVLPPFIYHTLARGFVEFGKKMKPKKGGPGYFTNEAVVVATESRTSTPVRIPRTSDTLTHPQLSNLYPCGEGAGYAGGIVSAAMDGEKVARQLVHTTS